MAAHRNAPQPDPACLYGLIGDVARAGSDGTETNAYAIAANFMAYLSCAVGRGVYLPVGNTRHHARLFCLHVGRSGRGRKGDAVSLVLRIDQALRAMDNAFAPQIHRGGLSTREGLAALIHDGYRQGRQDVPAIEDKRLWVVESEFANVLHQGRRDGNTLSAALRDCWDGVDLKPATKSNRLYASDPHVCLSGAISPGELTGLMSARELTNGFANRFLMIWAERTRMLPFPKQTPQSVVEQLARKYRSNGAERHEERDHLRMDLSPQAQCRYAQLYRGELNVDLGDDGVGALLERKAPMLLRLAMLLALTDLQTRIDALTSTRQWGGFVTPRPPSDMCSSAPPRRRSWCRCLTCRIGCWPFCASVVRPRAARSVRNAFAVSCPRSGSTPVWSICWVRRRPGSMCSGSSVVTVRQAHPVACTSWRRRRYCFADFV